MPSNIDEHQVRFKPGDKAVIKKDDPGRFAGLTGTVQEFQPHDRGVRVLDRYILVFEWGEKQSFYDAQLERA